MQLKLVCFFVSNKISTLYYLMTRNFRSSIDDGPLKRLLDKTKNLTPEERAKVLEEDEEF